jgi:FkbM family methyltransferase
MKLIIILILIFIIIFLYRKHAIHTDHFDNLVTVDDTIYGKFTCFSEDRHICNSIRNTKSWELSLSQEIEKYYKPESIFIDIGANYGVHSIYIANKIKNSNDSGKVYAFEIQPKIYNLFLKNIKDNNLESIIVPIFNGLGDTHSITDLIIPKDYDLHENPGGISLLNKKFTQSDDKIMTSIIKLDSLNLNNISIIKIDVESFEIEALSGALETINRNKPAIILEIWPDNKEKYFSWFDTNLPDYDIETLNGWDYLLKPKKN